MKLSAPKQVTFWVAVVVAVLALIAHLVPAFPVIGAGFWLLLLAFVILAIANLFEGL